jgi:hypothetical protein
VDKETIIKRINALQVEHRSASAHILRIEGAIQIMQELLQELEAPPVPGEMSS